MTRNGQNSRPAETDPYVIGPHTLVNSCVILGENSVGEGVCERTRGREDYLVCPGKVRQKDCCCISLKAERCGLWCWGGEWEEHSPVQILCFMNSLLPDGCDTLAHRTSAHHYFVTSAHQYCDISSSKSGHQLIKIRTFAHHMLKI